MKDSTADELRTCLSAMTVDRSEDLLESAQDYVYYGQPDRAVEIWEQLIAEGGEDTDQAHLDYAEYLFDEHEDDEAYTELGAVLSAGHFSARWLRAVDMVEDHKPAMALCLYLLAIETITAEELRNPARARRYLQLVAARRRLKWEFGIPLSDVDLHIEIGDSESRVKCWELLRLVTEVQVVDGQLRFWDRGALAALSQTWGRHTFLERPDAYYLEIKAVLQARSGGRAVATRMSIADWKRLAGLARDAKHLDDLQAIVSKYDGGTTVEWPPGRNQGCWCGSGVKYKKCCGWPPG